MPNSLKRKTMKTANSKIVSSEHRGWIGEDVQDNFFKGKTVVMTGDLKLLGERDPVAGLLQSLGARVTSAVSNKTQVMVIGEKPGPSKLEKAEQLRAEGSDIYLMSELELILKLHDAGVDLLSFVIHSPK